MIRILLLFLLSIALFLFSGALSRMDEPTPGTSAKGEITRLVVQDGFTMYYVQFTENGMPRSGQSVTYTVTNNKYQIGDQVDIQYHLLRNGDYMVEIQDDELRSAGKDSFPVASKVCLFLGAVMLLLALGSLWRFFRQLY